MAPLLSLAFIVAVASLVASSPVLLGNASTPLTGHPDCAPPVFDKEAKIFTAEMAWIQAWEWTKGTYQLHG
jgi:hypothetical protein